jgi:hypothetical protein
MCADQANGSNPPRKDSTSERDTTSVWYEAERQSRYQQWANEKWRRRTKDADSQTHRDIQRLGDKARPNKEDAA